MGFIFKKKVLPADQERLEAKLVCKGWRLSVNRAKPKRLIPIDETWFSTVMAKPRGFATREKRLASRNPHGHWKATTFVGGPTKSGIVAPMVLDGPTNGDSFKAIVEQVLAGVNRPGGLVVLDNLSSHTAAMVGKSLEDHGIRTRHLPPYSLDLTPIENAFSKLKSMVKSA